MLMKDNERVIFTPGLDRQSLTMFYHFLNNIVIIGKNDDKRTACLNSLVKSILESSNYSGFNMLFIDPVRKTKAPFANPNRHTQFNSLTSYVDASRYDDSIYSILDALSKLPTTQEEFDCIIYSQEGSNVISELLKNSSDASEDVQERFVLEDVFGEDDKYEEPILIVVNNFSMLRKDIKQLLQSMFKEANEFSNVYFIIADKDGYDIAVEAKWLFKYTIHTDSESFLNARTVGLRNLRNMSEDRFSCWLCDETVPFSISCCKYNYTPESLLNRLMKSLSTKTITSKESIELAIHRGSLASCNMMLPFTILYRTNCNNKVGGEYNE